MTKRFVTLIFILVIFCLGNFIQAETIRILPLESVNVGMKGYGLTDFGNGPEKFQFEVIGFSNGTMGMRYVLVRLFGGPSDYEGKNIIKEARVIRGMSGSPIYTEDGTLIGAISFGGASDTEPYAGVTPIQYTIGWRPNILSDEKYLGAFFNNDISGKESLSEKAPVQKLTPGSAYSYALVWGDDFLGGTATITAVDDGGPFLAQGHPSWGLGVTGLPVFKAKIFGIKPNLGMSSVIGDVDQNQNILGVVFFDGPFGHLGVFGEKPRSFNLNIRVKGVFPNDRIFNDHVALLPPTFMSGVIGYTLEQKVDGIFDSYAGLNLKTRVAIDGLPEIYVTERYKGGIFGLYSLGLNAFGRVSRNLIEKGANLYFELEAVPVLQNSKIVQADISPFRKQDESVSIRIVTEAISENKKWEHIVRVPFKEKMKSGRIFISDGEAALDKLMEQNIGDEREFIKLVSEFGDSNNIFIYYLNEETFEFKSESDRKPFEEWKQGKSSGKIRILAKIKIPEDGYRISGLIEKKAVIASETDSKNESFKKKPWFRKIFIF